MVTGGGVCKDKENLGEEEEEEGKKDKEEVGEMVEGLCPAGRNQPGERESE